jgi:cellulose synthase/poly-beta-1,6-N-acetylglucosamine synthase-like glycosyltransferase
MVQTRWKHLNEEYSLLTKLQAFGLDAHFVVEQCGRSMGGHFINFNGTAGIWRKQCIIDSGGWSSDTLTEDLDLSYRAQLKGWKFRYLPGVGSPSELPSEMNSLKSQQYRWTKGAAECAVKNLPKVFSARNIGFGTKVHALFHLLNSFIFVCILSTSLLSVPLLQLKPELDNYETLFRLASVFLLSFLVLGVFYWISRPECEHRGFMALPGFIGSFLLFLSVSMGLSLHNAIAVLEGYFGRKTSFVRTPKFGIAKKGDSWADKQYRSLRMNPLTFGELLLAGYFAYGIYLAFRMEDYGMLLFHGMLGFGFFYVAFQSIFQLRGAN